MRVLVSGRTLLQSAFAPFARQGLGYVCVCGLFHVHAHGNGINVYRIAGLLGIWTHVQHIGNLINPGFLITSSDHRFLYSSH
jgi:hypothetical protein